MSAVRDEDRTLVAVIGDLRRSRAADDRAALQRRFERALEAAAEPRPAGALQLPDPDPVSGPTITTGDEFQTLFGAPEEALELVLRLDEALHPVRARYGLGAGALETPVNPDDAIGMDGPCFHRARAALEGADRTDRWVQVEGFGDRVDPAASATLDLAAAVRAGWTDRQRSYAEAYRELGVQAEVAERFDVAKSTVSESLAAANAHRVFEALRETAGLLDDVHARDRP
jgi:hypothetical protein